MFIIEFYISKEHTVACSPYPPGAQCYSEEGRLEMFSSQDREHGLVSQYV